MGRGGRDVNKAVRGRRKKKKTYEWGKFEQKGIIRKRTLESPLKVKNLDSTSGKLNLSRRWRWQQ